MKEKALIFIEPTKENLTRESLNGTLFSAMLQQVNEKHGERDGLIAYSIVGGAELGLTEQKYGYTIPNKSNNPLFDAEFINFLEVALEQTDELVFMGYDMLEIIFVAVSIRDFLEAQELTIDITIAKNMTTPINYQLPQELLEKLNRREIKLINY